MGATKDGAALIAEERRRQVEQEHWTPEHDDEHDACELARAGVCYAQAGVDLALGNRVFPRAWASWPWDMAWWKPSDDPIRNLVKAGALIASEIDRLQRKDKRKPDDAEACDGTGWVVLNPDWPNGELPYRDRCGGCDNCEEACDTPKPSVPSDATGGGR